MKIIREDKKNIEEIITALKNGAVLVLATDTVYGLVCDASNKEAVEKIFNIKKRDRSKPLPIFVRDIAMAMALAEINPEQEKALKKRWPGKYTFILKSKCQNPKPKIYGINKDTIALRIPKYKFLNNLLEKIDKPLAQTSANISGQTSLVKINDIIKQFNDTGVLVVDGGDINDNKSSKIIDLTKNMGNILRK